MYYESQTRERNEKSMTFVIVTIIMIYLILIFWTWQSLGSIEKTKKIVWILIGMFVLYLVTLVVFLTAKVDIEISNIEIQNSIKNIIIAIGTGINGIIVMPQMGKIVSQIKENQIEKEKLMKKMIILVFIFVICLIFESGYMRDTQEGILKVYHSIGSER